MCFVTRQDTGEHQDPFVVSAHSVVSALFVVSALELMCVYMCHHRHWERQDVEEETKLKAQLMRADTQRIQSMTQAEHKNRERAAMEFNDVRAAVGRSRCLLKEMRARQRKAAATVAGTCLYRLVQTGRVWLLRGGQRERT